MWLLSRRLNGGREQCVYGLHTASIRNDAVVQIQSTGPFEINCVNPADDPRKKMDAGRMGRKP